MERKFKRVISISLIVALFGTLPMEARAASAGSGDPLAGLSRPDPKEISIPRLPHYFCSKEERTKFWQNFQPEWLEAADNVADASSYRAEVSRRGAAHFINDGDPAQQKRLDSEERWADRNFAEHLRMRERADAIRDMILSTPIIDCSLLSKNSAPDAAALEGRAAGIKQEIQVLDERIAEIDRKLAESKAEVDREIPPELDEAYQRGLLEAEGQFGFDLAQWLKRVYRYEQSLKRERADLEWQKKTLERDLESTSRLVQELRDKAAKSETPRQSEEVYERVQQTRPGLFESLLPALIPSISIAIGGGKSRHQELERRFEDRR